MITPCVMIRETEHRLIGRVGGWYVKLIRLLDEDRWPAAIRASAYVAILGIFFFQMLIFLMVTP